MSLDIEKVNVLEKSKLFQDTWAPRILGELNGQHVKVAYFEGEFGWHHHELEDEMFYVISGEINIETRTETFNLKENEFVIIPKGVEHNPNAKEKSLVMLLEPLSTLNTGNTVTQNTVRNPEKI